MLTEIANLVKKLEKKEDVIMIVLNYESPNIYILDLVLDNEEYYQDGLLTIDAPHFKGKLKFFYHKIFNLNSYFWERMNTGTILLDRNDLAKKRLK